MIIVIQFVAYFDIYGSWFKSRAEHHLSVFKIYLSLLQRKVEKEAGVGPKWFKTVC